MTCRKRRWALCVGVFLFFFLGREDGCWIAAEEADAEVGKTGLLLILGGRGPTYRPVDALPVI